ncbi:hypothetical protein IHV10_06475 [Fictibacillus sp. 5RED26]|uniref:hypothetical protein n=1 Tax=Fictibacillus sp. 5RED26 TaxID=2745876 RepID=UPI0018CF8AC1|nr:hypothetical protein [Fictibacillus sp. 5RED26]MBH0156008.1 hypothetical protein [Fictibacillus sp. 5RED26]
MKSEMKCLVCNGSHFQKGSYIIDTEVNVYSTAYNSVRADSRVSSYNSDYNIDVDTDVDVSTQIDNEVNADSDMVFQLQLDNKEYENISPYKYACEDCGYIMSFSKSKNVESKEGERKRKQREKAYDWSNFKK